MSRRSRWGLFLVTLVATAVAWSLALWQVGRLKQRRTESRMASAASDLPVLELSGPSGSLDSAVVPHRRVRVRGRWESNLEFVLRGRVEQETPGVLLVTGLRLEGTGILLLVNRGFVPASDAFSFDAAIVQPTPDTLVTLEGLAFPLPDDPDGGAPVAAPGGSLTYRRLNAPAAFTATADSLLPWYLLLAASSDPPGWPRTIAPPRLDDGPHLSYAIQWLGIGLAALAFGLLFVLRRPTGNDRGPPST